MLLRQKVLHYITAQLDRFFSSLAKKKEKEKEKRKENKKRLSERRRKHSIIDQFDPGLYY